MLILRKLTGWGLRELLGLTWRELLEWLDDAVAVEKELNVSP